MKVDLAIDESLERWNDFIGVIVTRMIMVAVSVMLMVMLVVVGMMMMRHGRCSGNDKVSLKLATLVSVVVGLCNAGPFIYCQITCYASK